MFSFIRRLDKPARALLYTCFFAFYCNGSLALIMGSAMPDLKAVYGLTDTVSGIFLSAHSAGNLIAGFISGLVPLWLGQRKSIMLLASLGFIGFAMMLLFGNPVWLFVSFLFTGLGRGSTTQFGNRTVNMLSGGSPIASNLLHSSFALGAILMPLIFLGLRTLIGWQAGLVYLILCGVVSIFNLSRMRLEKDIPDRADKTNRSFAFLKNPSFLILAMMMLCYLCSEYAINGWLVTYIQNKENLLSAFEASGLSITAYSQSMATLMWVVMLIGRLSCAVLSARVSQKKLMMFSSFGVVIFFALMLFSSTIPMVTFAVAGLGLCMAGICPMIYSDAAPFTNAYPLATSMILCFGSGGAILMPTVVGALAERFGFTGGMSAILVTVSLLVVFSVLNVTVKNRAPKVSQ